MGIQVSCQCKGALCIALIPKKGRATGAPPQLSPRLGQSLCVADGDEHSVPLHCARRRAQVLAQHSSLSGSLYCFTTLLLPNVM